MEDLYGFIYVSDISYKMATLAKDWLDLSLPLLRLSFSRAFSLHTSPTSKVVGLLYMMAKKKKDKLDGLLGLGCELAKYHLQHILLVNQITGAAKIQREGTWILPLCERSSIPSQGWGEFLAALFAQYSSLFVKKQTHILHSLVK